jgi:hypothetical protein
MGLNTMCNSKHKHYDVIMAWASGNLVQHRQSQEKEWKDYPDTPISPGWQEDYEYRIKPATEEYRVYLTNSGVVYICHSRDSEYVTQSSSIFLRWLTDWTEYEA